MDDFLSRVLSAGDPELPLPLRIAENDTVLYWWMALDMYQEISADLAQEKETVFIVPVGPVYQYRYLIDLLTALPLSLSGLHLFFMDEYLDENDGLLSMEHPLSFRGFIGRELASLVAGKFDFRKAQLHFPSPDNPEAYDADLEKLGGASVCYAGVGINEIVIRNSISSWLT